MFETWRKRESGRVEKVEEDKVDGGETVVVELGSRSIQHCCRYQLSGCSVSLQVSDACTGILSTARAVVSFPRQHSLAMR